MAHAGADVVFDGVDSPVTHPLSPLTVNCQDFTRTITSANGKSVQTQSWAFFPEVAVGDDFEVRMCGLTVTQVPAPPSCPAG